MTSGGGWRKLGLVFDLAQHALPDWCVGWAQSPQAVVLADRVRVHFSTRAVDPANGKYLSQVLFVDLTKDLTSVLGVATEPVISLGELGCFDEHGIFPLSVVREGDLLYGYTCGWSRRTAVSVETAIGLAISADNGLTFQRSGPGPVLAASLHEPFLVGDGFVRRINDTFHMWYIFGTGWSRPTTDAAPDRTYKIGHATSGDGVAWTKNQEGRPIVPDVLGSHESQALPTVAEIDGRHHMFFCYRQTFDFRTNRDRGYRIGHAWSEDLQDWTRDDAQLAISPTPGNWDSDMLCYPHVFHCEGRTYLLYNGNEFGRHGFGAAVLEQ